MEQEKIVRLSLELPESEHKYLKMCCVKLGISIKEFVLSAAISRLDEQEDEWMEPVYKKRDAKREKTGGCCIDTSELLEELGIKGAL